MKTTNQANRFRRTREGLGMTVADLATLLGTDEFTAARLERDNDPKARIVMGNAAWSSHRRVARTKS